MDQQRPTIPRRESMTSIREDHRELISLGRRLREAIPDVYAGYAQLHNASMGDGALPARFKELIALAIAVTRECDGCVVAHARGAARGDREGGRRDDGGGHPHERRPGHGLGAARLRRLPGVRRRGQPTRVLTAAVSSPRAFLASAKYMLVLGSTYSSLSMPA